MAPTITHTAATSFLSPVHATTKFVMHVGSLWPGSCMDWTVVIDTHFTHSLAFESACQTSQPALLLRPGTEGAQPSWPCSLYYSSSVLAVHFQWHACMRWTRVLCERPQPEYRPCVGSCTKRIKSRARHTAPTTHVRSSLHVTFLSLHTDSKSNSVDTMRDSPSRRFILAFLAPGSMVGVGELWSKQWHLHSAF